MTRIDVRKTYKLYIGGAFPRSESRPHLRGQRRQGQVPGQRRAGLPQGRPRRGRRRPQGRSAAGPARTAYNRGQVLYRDRRGARGPARQFVDERARSRGPRPRPGPTQVVDAAIDRLVWYAGWADKIAQVVGNANPVAGPYFNLSVPEPTGVVAVLAPAGVVAARPGLGGRAGRSSPATPSSWWPASARPLPAVTFAEVLATSDVPGGVVNMLTGSRGRDRARGWPRTWTSTRIDLTGVAGDAELATDARGGRGREPQAGAAGRPAPSPTGPPTPGSTG